MQGCVRSIDSLFLPSAMVVGVGVMVVSGDLALVPAPIAPDPPLL